MIYTALCCLFFTSQYSSHQPREAICIRDLSEQIKLFAGKKKMKVDDSGTARREESKFVEMLEQSTVFADKTLLTKKIMDTDKSVIVINAPSKSGKTTNLNMLKTFFEIRVNKIGTFRRIPRTSSSKFFTYGRMNTAKDRPLQPMRHILPSGEISDNHILPSDEISDNHIQPSGEISDNNCSSPNRSSEKGEVVQVNYINAPMISKDRAMLRQHLGKYPVIYLDLQRDSACFEGQNNPLGNSVCYFFQKQKFLSYKLDQLANDDSKKASTRKIAAEHQQRLASYQAECSARQLNYTELANSIVGVSEIFYDLWDKQVFVFIDDYTKILENDLIEGEKNPTITNDHVESMKDFIKIALVGNAYMRKAILTDTLSIHRTYILKDVFFLTNYSAIDNDLQEFYGFTENEVNMLFDYFQIPADLAKKARLYYKGYKMKSNSSVITYNMQSIGEFLNEKKIADYWFRRMKHSKLDTNVKYWLDFAKLSNILQPLLGGDTVPISFTEIDLNTRELRLFIHPENNELLEPTKKAVDSIFSLLLEIGFFTIDHAYHSDGTSSEIYIQIANEEVKRGLTRILANSSMVLQLA